MCSRANHSLRLSVSLNATVDTEAKLAHNEGKRSRKNNPKTQLLTKRDCHDRRKPDMDFMFAVREGRK